MVKNSVGTYNNAYAGLSNSTGNMTQSVDNNSTTISLSGNKTYYSIYRTNVINNYYDGTDYVDRTIYRNQCFLSTIEMSDTFLSTTVTGLDNYEPEVGPDGAEWLGLNATQNPYVTYHTVIAAATSSDTVLRTIYLDNTMTPPTISYESNAVSDGLVFGFDARNNTGDGHNNAATSWNNFGTNSANGTINGATWGNNYLEFDGVDDYVNTAAFTSTTFTFEALFSINYLGSVSNIIANTSSGGLQLYVDGNGYIEATIYANNNYNLVNTDVLVTPDTIYNVSVTYDGTVVNIYVNGKKAGTLSISGYKNPTTGTLLTFGCGPNSSGGCNENYSDYHMEGKLYAARVYNRALTASEVKQNYKMDMLAAGNYTSGHPSFVISGGESNYSAHHTYNFNENVEWYYYDDEDKPIVQGNGENTINARLSAGFYRVGKPTSHTVYLDNISPMADVIIESPNGELRAVVLASDEGGSELSNNYGYKITNSEICDSTTTGFVDVESSNYTFSIQQTGDNYICVRVEDNAGNISYTSKKVPSSYFTFTGDYQIYTVQKSGYYYIEAWGAQGGGKSTNPGGKGGYSAGYIYLNKDDVLYVYVGDYGYEPGNLQKPFNGGGAPDITGTWTSSHTGMYSGGGATDIRYFGNNIPTTSNLEWDSLLDGSWRWWRR